ncbi:hypothetical protein [Streptomyces lanatus]|uniref:Uncharacterized protein n=1 Tax=Streptomyces lanatus TaxID=66900 RepID=A0ABV1XST4_9ACTN|nr:hypothetical protein [Streptomyces lanatus]GHH07544.1 hypothetical protein GCM10018780_41500 [Streptomyces lanatus]
MMGVAYQALGISKYIPEDRPCERQYVSYSGTDEVQHKIKQTRRKALRRAGGG